MALFCVLMLLPHIFYGPGDEALKWTKEYGSQDGALNHTTKDENLCYEKDLDCVKDTGDFVPILMFFVAQFIGGIGCSLYYAPGLAYMDDNSDRAKTPAMLSRGCHFILLQKT